MKFTNFVTASVLTLALVGTNLIPAMAEEKESVQQEMVLNQGADDQAQYYDNDEHITPVANYSNVQLVQGTFTFKYHVGLSNKDVRYHVKNSGSNSFSWKIIDPKGGTWSNGSSKPGESGTWTAFWDLDSIPVGEYTFIVTSHNGGPGAFDFSARVLD
ncbi:hypothetical protein [Lysinibacillus sp. ZYM-1]|uniref:hypothetical protein n=1 Tax=Lysinibacillus sp. ZYM-1 TaxID=1681184 RepID=UPI0006CE791D|nr:hypothetical protein [Lysinibacillus sp. ZYM-1]KPN95025.1 hypothetical protein AO843_21750 [Lysinibacillus sp. ZYM-1]